MQQMSLASDFPQEGAGFSEVPEEKLQALGLDMTLDRAIEDWLARENVEDLAVKVCLYRYGDGADAAQKYQVDQWENVFPDAHSIGLAHGAGRYEIYVSYPKGNRAKPGVKVFRVKLHKHYDELRNKRVRDEAMGLYHPAAQGPRPDLPATVPANGASVLQEGLGAVKEVLALIVPLLSVQNQGAQNSPDMSALMMGMYGNMGKVMQKQMMENIELYSDMQRQVAAVHTPQENDTMSEASGIIAQIAPWIEGLLPVLLGKGPKATAAASTVRALPQFSKLLQDKRQVAEVVSYLDGEIGPAKTNTVLQKLKVKRPAAKTAAAPG